MIKLIKKRKKNPNLVEYGYHFTRSTDIDSIMKQGLIPGFKINKNSRWYDWLSACQKKIIGYFYNNKAPIYFSDIPSTKNLPASLVEHFNAHDYNKCLKINVTNLNQLPDLFMLHVDYGDYALNVNHLKYKKIKSLDKILEKYKYIVPFYILKNDEELQSELIFLTGTFIINEKISPNRIEKITNVKYD